MTPLLEEIGGLARIPWDSTGLLMPENRKGRGLLKMMGLKKNPNLTSLKDSYISFDFMYERLGHSKSYRNYVDEFDLTSLEHIHRRAFVFMFCFLGMMAFPMKKTRIHTRLAMLTKTIMEGIDEQTFSIAPMILAELYQSLEKCQQREPLFEGCNPLLQLWLIEHLQRAEYKQEIIRRDWDDHIAFYHPKRKQFIRICLLTRKTPADGLNY